MFFDSLRPRQLARLLQGMAYTPFATHGLNSLSWRPNECDSSFCTFLGEVWILTQLHPVSLDTTASVLLLVVQIRNPDVYPGSLAPSQCLLSCRHQDTRKGRRD